MDSHPQHLSRSATSVSLGTVEQSAALLPSASLVTDLVAMTKPRLTTMVLMTVAVGYLVGARGGWHPLAMMITVAATGLVAGAASVWNQILERDRDRLMRRTASRPLPSGRVQPWEAGLFAMTLLISGLLALALWINPLASVMAGLTFLIYVGLYTPLKTRTTLNTAIGAIPGALPPVIGWAGATGRLGVEALVLFLILWLWQFPHFLAIAWIYRRDYAQAGYRMLSRDDAGARLCGHHSVLHALALVPVSLMPSLVGLAGPIFFVGALLGSLTYLGSSWRFATHGDDSTARRLLYSSFVYLPLIFGLLLLDPRPA